MIDWKELELRYTRNLIKFESILQRVRRTNTQYLTEYPTVPLLKITKV